MNASELVGRRVTVEAPATIANLGAGYDTLGLAVTHSLRVAVEAREGDRTSPVELKVQWQGVDELPADRSNRFVVALEEALAALGIAGVDRLAWTIEMRNEIPLERGLGSSAAATVAGIVAAGALAGHPIDAATALRLATRIEGHPDNVAPALLGGLTASVTLESGIETIRLEPPDDITIVAWIPVRRLATKEMRRVLPDVVPRADAVANVARVAFGVAGLASGRSDALALLTQDRLHEPYRAAAYPELPSIVAAARAAGAIGACLAGSGSTVAAFVAADGPVDEVGDAMQAASQELGLPGVEALMWPQPAGARLVDTD